MAAHSSLPPADRATPGDRACRDHPPADQPDPALRLGSSTHIPKLCGLPVTGAEMWFGAHPANPSLIETGERLDEVIAHDPEAILGKHVFESFGPRLPFLMELLAAAEPLSLQVHPTSERARIRFAEQNAAGIPLDAPERSYQDPSHKPELIYALTRFDGMTGFRDVEKTATILRMLGLPRLDEMASELADTRTPFQKLRKIVTELLACLPGSETSTHRDRRRTSYRRSAVAPAATQTAITRGGPRRHRPREAPRARADAGTGEAVSGGHGRSRHAAPQPRGSGAGRSDVHRPGMIHAYTSGFGVEIMATSDNVLRAGLTAKYVDASELLDVTNFTPVPPRSGATHRSPMAPDSCSRRPVEEFELVVVDVSQTPHKVGPGPVVVLCVDGTAAVQSAAGRGRGAHTWTGSVCRRCGRQDHCHGCRPRPSRRRADSFELTQPGALRRSDVAVSSQASDPFFVAVDGRFFGQQILAVAPATLAELERSLPITSKLERRLEQRGRIAGVDPHSCSCGSQLARGGARRVGRRKDRSAGHEVGGQLARHSHVRHLRALIHQQHVGTRQNATEVLRAHLVPKLQRSHSLASLLKFTPAAAVTHKHEPDSRPGPISESSGLDDVLQALLRPHGTGVQNNCLVAPSQRTPRSSDIERRRCFDVCPVAYHRDPF
jgi:mannose-6-phosphate isomerase